jgi:hypothetical protein
MSNSRGRLGQEAASHLNVTGTGTISHLLLVDWQRGSFRGSADLIPAGNNGKQQRQAGTGGGISSQCLRYRYDKSSSIGERVAGQRQQRIS